MLREKKRMNIKVGAVEKLMRALISTKGVLFGSVTRSILELWNQDPQKEDLELLEFLSKNRNKSIPVDDKVNIGFANMEDKQEFCKIYQKPPAERNGTAKAIRLLSEPKLSNRYFCTFRNAKHYDSSVSYGVYNEGDEDPLFEEEMSVNIIVCGGVIGHGRCPIEDFDINCIVFDRDREGPLYTESPILIAGIEMKVSDAMKNIQNRVATVLPKYYEIMDHFLEQVEPREGEKPNHFPLDFDDDRLTRIDRMMQDGWTLRHPHAYDDKTGKDIEKLFSPEYLGYPREERHNKESSSPSTKKRKVSEEKTITNVLREKEEKEQSNTSVVFKAGKMGDLVVTPREPVKYTLFSMENMKPIVSMSINFEENCLRLVGQKGTLMLPKANEYNLHFVPL
jgi:hypothetical protein